MLGYADLKGLSGTVLSSSTRVNVLSWFYLKGILGCKILFLCLALRVRITNYSGC